MTSSDSAPASQNTSSQHSAYVPSDSSQNQVSSGNLPSSSFTSGLSQSSSLIFIYHVSPPASLPDASVQIEIRPDVDSYTASAVPGPCSSSQSGHKEPKTPSASPFFDQASAEVFAESPARPVQGGSPRVVPNSQSSDIVQQDSETGIKASKSSFQPTLSEQIGATSTDQTSSTDSASPALDPSASSSLGLRANLADIPGVVNASIVSYTNSHELPAENSIRSSLGQVSSKTQGDPTSASIDSCVETQTFQSEESISRHLQVEGSSDQAIPIKPNVQPADLTDRDLETHTQSQKIGTSLTRARSASPLPDTSLPSQYSSSIPQAPSLSDIVVDSQIPPQPQTPKMDSPSQGPALGTPEFAQLSIDEKRRLRNSYFTINSPSTKTEKQNSKENSASSNSRSLDVTSVANTQQKPETDPSRPNRPTSTTELVSHDPVLNAPAVGSTTDASKSRTSSGTSSKAQTGPRRRSLTKLEARLPLPLIRESPDLYKGFFRHNGKLLSKLRATDPSKLSSPAMVEEMSALVAKLQTVTLHNDLLNTGFWSQPDVDAHITASWAKECSSKYRFLWNLFQVIKNWKMHFVIFVKPGKASELTQTFLQGNDIAYRRKLDSSFVQGTPLMITVLDTNLTEDSQTTCNDVNLIIGLDDSFSPSLPLVKRISQVSREAGKRCSVLSLVVPYTVEHVSLMLPEAMAHHERLYRLLLASEDLAGKAGKTEAKPQFDCLGRVAARSLLDIGDASQRLPDLEDYPILPSVLRSPEIRAQEGAAKGKISRKRLAEDIAEGTPDPKKSRPSPHPTQSTLPQSSLSTQVVSETSPSSKEQASQQMLVDAQREIIDATQPELEKLIMENKDLKGRIQHLEGVTENVSALKETVAKQKTDIKNYRSELAAQRELLAASENPEIRELAELREKAAQSTSLESKVASKQKDFEYVTNQYQIASEAAAESSHELKDLKEEIAKLKQKAEDKPIRHREASKSNIVSKLQKELQKSQLTLATRERSLAHSETENARLRQEMADMKAQRGMTTRSANAARGVSNSVDPEARRKGPTPRSGTPGMSKPPVPIPRVLRPPGATSNGSQPGSKNPSRTGSRMNSRQASPARASVRGSNLKEVQNKSSLSQVDE